MDEQNHFTSEENPSFHENLPSTQGNDSITWTASEFIDHSKSFSWYLIFFVVILTISFLVYLFTKSFFSSIAIFILGLAIGYTATRRPKDVNYGLDNKGLVINNTDYSFSEFKSYSLVSEGGLAHISLIPVRRFSPNKTIYFEPQDEDRIANLLGQYLPKEIATNDPIDKFMKKIGL